MTISGKKLFFVPAALLIIVGAGIYFVELEEECPVNTEERIVRGNSLSELIEPGETVRVFFGYYDCNEIQREDLVLYDYAGNQNPLIKIVKGIPGDRFSFQETGSGWHILINDKILKNSENESYLLDQRSYNLLSLYEKDYEGAIPENAYLIMGNLVGGATDSTRYGLVSKGNILAKAEPLEKHE